MGEPVHVDDEPHVVTRRAGTADKPILRLQGVATREAAEALRGRSLLVARPELEADEVWAEDLIGAPVTDGDAVVGEVARVLAYPSCEVLLVARPEQADLLVPLVGDAVRAASPEGVDVDLQFLGES